MSNPSTTEQASKPSRQKFTPEEDELLRKLVSTYGEHSWKSISKEMKTRTTRQCRERFKNYLSPDVKNGPWTMEEDQLLISKYSELGPKWSKMASCFNSRSDVNVKNRYALLVSKGLAAQVHPIQKTGGETLTSIFGDFWSDDNTWSFSSAATSDGRQDSDTVVFGTFGW